VTVVEAKVAPCQTPTTVFPFHITNGANMAKAKTPRTNKTKAKPQTKPAAAAKPTKAEAAKVAAGHNTVDPKHRELFLVHQKAVDAAHKAQKEAVNRLRTMLKKAKADGFEKLHFDVARQLATPEGEAQYTERLRKELTAAQYVGSTIGNQLDLFGGPDRTDATERAYDEGQKASMTSGPAKPDYAPGTLQYEAFMKGYQDHQGGITAGFKSIDKGAKPAAEAARAARKPPRASATKPTEAPAETDQRPHPVSGQMISRAEFNRMAEQQQGGEPESQFKRA
jgi:hypothetical protein